jgi:hypothetical protein
MRVHITAHISSEAIEAAANPIRKVVNMLQAMQKKAAMLIVFM